MILNTYKKTIGGMHQGSPLTKMKKRKVIILLNCVSTNWSWKEVPSWVWPSCDTISKPKTFTIRIRSTITSARVPTKRFNYCSDNSKTFNPIDSMTHIVEIILKRSIPLIRWHLLHLGAFLVMYNLPSLNWHVSISQNSYTSKQGFCCSHGFMSLMLI